MAGRLTRLRQRVRTLSLLSFIVLRNRAADLESIGSDGSFIYPCQAGPCGSIRLKNLRDGIEDWGACSLIIIIWFVGEA